MRKTVFILVVASLINCQITQAQHQEPTHNFTVARLIIVNDANEILMGKVESNWYPPSLVYNQRQYIGESLDSLSNEYGIKTLRPQLRAYVSYKYEYHPYATLRPFYVANYKSGSAKLPKGIEEVKWMPIEEALKAIPVEGMKAITAQVLKHPKTVWGGSFMVYRKGKEHHTRVVEPLYPLFSVK